MHELLSRQILRQIQRPTHCWASIQPIVRSDRRAVVRLVCGTPRQRDCSKAKQKKYFRFDHKVRFAFYRISICPRRQGPAFTENRSGLLPAGARLSSGAGTTAVHTAHEYLALPGQPDLAVPEDGRAPISESITPK